MSAPHTDDRQAELGEWVHGLLMERFGLETERWALERVARATERLNAVRAPSIPLTTEVLWLQEMTAFIGPGRYVYISRELLQRTASDDPAALVIAHEMAHHDLGHTDIFRGPLAALRKVPFGDVAAILGSIAQNAALGPAREAEADARARDLCLLARYDGHKCLELFDILEAYGIDHGDIGGVFGNVTRADSEPESRSITGRFMHWKEEHLRGYQPLKQRRQVLEKRLAYLLG